jgi:hypothetical protein
MNSPPEFSVVIIQSENKLVVTPERDEEKKVANSNVRMSARS